MSAKFVVGMVEIGTDPDDAADGGRVHRPQRDFGPLLDLLSWDDGREGWYLALDDWIKGADVGGFVADIRQTAADMLRLAEWVEAQR